MEKERQRKCEIDHERRSQEMNGNSPSFLGKRKKSRESKHGAYLQEWLEKSSTFQQNDGAYGIDPEPVDGLLGHQPSTYWSPHATVPVTGQRLFAAVSDPTVCRYSVPVGYSLEPISLPLYPVYQSPVPVPAGRTNLKPAVRLPIRGRPSRRSHRVHLPAYPPPVSVDGWQSHRQTSRTVPSSIVRQGALPNSQPSIDLNNGQEFTSLPPVTQSDISNPSQRRFSDPGLGPLPNCHESSDESSNTPSSRGSSPTALGLVLSLVEQVNALQESNRQLFHELHDIRVEVETLKLQAASWRPLPPDYEPGMLSGLIREVRDAARVREEALLSRVRDMLSSADAAKWDDLTRQKICGTSSNEKVSSVTREIQDLKDQQQKLTEKSVSDEKVVQLEDQLNDLQLQISKQIPGNTSLAESNKGDHSDERPLIQQIQDFGNEEMNLVRDLQEALSNRKMTCPKDEAHSQKRNLSQKKINGVIQDAKQHDPVSLEQSPSSLENTSESSVSVRSSSTNTGRSSIHSAQVTMLGPVTDL